MLTPLLLSVMLCLAGRVLGGSFGSFLQPVTEACNAYVQACSEYYTHSPQKHCDSSTMHLVQVCSGYYTHNLTAL